MQTFLPYPDFHESASCLDRQRLGKQRVEVLQILRTLSGEKEGWINHPAVRMWRGHEIALVEYGLTVCLAWKARGYRDSCFAKIESYSGRFKAIEPVLPSWLGDGAFHASHRSNLLRKDAAFYSRFGWTDPSDLPYVWPS